MSEMKHTPGPWAHESKKGPHNVEGTVSSMGIFSVSKFNDFMEEEDANECDAIDASWVCGIWGEISDEDEANARLIAAAPDLLAELDVRVGDLVMLRRAIEEGDQKAELLLRVDDMLRRTRAAIAKAGAA